MEWDGALGVVRYYDKEKEVNVKVDLPFTFVLLDKLAVIKGWHKSSKSGITSNEVKDTRGDPFVVKAFKAGIIAEGFYSDIKDHVIVAGGHFTLNCYIAFHMEQDLTIGSIQLKGKALSEWMDFEKKNRNVLFKKAVRIVGAYEGKKGTIEFQVPIFEIHELSAETDAQATSLDRELQEYLKNYFKRAKVEQTDEPHPPPPPANPDEDEIPF